jgi:hypothetical protein
LANRIVCPAPIDAAVFQALTSRTQVHRCNQQQTQGKQQKDQNILGSLLSATNREQAMRR